MIILPSFPSPFPLPPSSLSPSLSYLLVVDIVPEIPEVNISTYRVNSKVTIGCPVQTCAEQVHVQFLKGVSTISTIEAVSGETASVYNLVLDVTETARGRYACKVDTTNPDASTMMEFEVVGTLYIVYTLTSIHVCHCEYIYTCSCLVV